MPQAQTVAQPPRFPLVVGPENRDADTAKDAKLINAYVEVDQAQQKIFVYKRPGLLQTGTTKTGNGYGVFNWLGDIYSIFGATMYKNGVALSGTLDTTGGMYRFSQCVGATPRMQFGNGAASYNYDSGAGIVQIPAGVDNFPTTCVKGWAYLDGTTYVMDANASIRGCATINDPTDWSDVLNRITAQIEADGGVFLSHQLVYVIALSQWSTEVFYDALNPTGSPPRPGPRCEDQLRLCEWRLSAGDRRDAVLDRYEPFGGRPDHHGGSAQGADRFHCSRRAVAERR
jgi:hypothetical protein